MRFENWPERLDEVTRKWAMVPFARPNADCVAFAVDVVKELTGREITHPFAGQYHDEASANACAQELAGSLENAVTLYLGDPMSPTFAQRGDIVMSRGNIGVCIGEEALFRSPNGLLRLKLRRCEIAWRVE